MELQLFSVVLVGMFSLVSLELTKKKGVPQTFWGRFDGKCQHNGLYYEDINSFVFCFHGNSYVMPCAPGTKNSEYEAYKSEIGKEKSDMHFCNVNLVAFGYNEHPAFENVIYGRRIKNDYYANMMGRQGYKAPEIGVKGQQHDIVAQNLYRTYNPTNSRVITRNGRYSTNVQKKRYPPVLNHGYLGGIPYSGSSLSNPEYIPREIRPVQPFLPQIPPRSANSYPEDKVGKGKEEKVKETRNQVKVKVTTVKYNNKDGVKDFIHGFNKRKISQPPNQISNNNFKYDDPYLPDKEEKFKFSRSFARETDSNEVHPQENIIERKYRNSYQPGRENDDYLKAPYLPRKGIRGHYLRAKFASEYQPKYYISGSK